jgi:hypothetical protein
VHLGGGDAEPAGFSGEVTAAGMPSAVLSFWSLSLASPTAAYRSRTLVAASVHPSVASRRYLDRIARLVGAPSSLVSIQPRGSATWGEPSLASAVVTSRSGLGPGDSLRNTLSMDSSP